jgi:hypothetical protein
VLFPKPIRRIKLPRPILRTSLPRRRRKGEKAMLIREADRLWARVVKQEGKCWFAGSKLGRNDHICRGWLQAMHGIPRTYRATRWLPINGFAGCQAVHMYFTHRPEEWSAYLVEAWGPEVFQELWHKARSHEIPDIKAVVESLRSELIKLEGSRPLDEGGKTNDQRSEGRSDLRDRPKVLVGNTRGHRARLRTISPQDLPRRSTS